MGFVVEAGSGVSDLPYLQAAMDQAGRFLVGRYSMARDMLALAVHRGPRLAAPPRNGLLAVAGGPVATPGPLDPAGAVVRARSNFAARTRGDRLSREAMRRSFLG